MDTGRQEGDDMGRATDGGRRSHIAPGAGDAGPPREAPELPLRNPPRMLSHLGRHLGWHTRTVNVTDQLEQRLGCLDRSEWLRVRSLPLEKVEVAVPFVLFGPTGVFILQASRGYWLDTDIDLMARAASALGRAIRDYPDPVRPCVVILDGTSQERQHFTGTGKGPCWIVSDGRLLPWLLRFRDYGFSQGDIARLHGLANPARIRETERLAIPRGAGHSPGTAPEDHYFPG
jgi:hypothetical protein